MNPNATADRIARQDRARSFHQSLRAAVESGAELDLGPADRPLRSEPTALAAGSQPGVNPSQKSAASGDDSQHQSDASAAGLGGIATLPKIDRLEAFLMQSFESETTVEAAPVLPQVYVAAFELFEQTGQIDLVLDSLSLQRTIDNDLARTLRPAWFYLALLLLVATAGIAVFTKFTSPHLLALRTDMELVPRVAVSQSWMAAWRADSLMFFLPVLAAVMLWLALSTKPSAWIATAMGGNRYRSDRIAAMKNRIENASLSCRPTPQARGHEARLSLITENQTYRANTRLMRLRLVLPTLIIAVVGGGGVLAYCLVLFGPLVMLIHDMATLAADHGVWP